MRPTPAPEPVRRPLPEAVVEQLAELWCDVLVANLRRHPIEEPALKQAS